MLFERRKRQTQPNARKQVMLNDDTQTDECQTNGGSYSFCTSLRAAAEPS